MVEIAKFNGPLIPFAIGPVPMAVQWVIPIYVGYYTGSTGYTGIRTDYHARFDLDMGLKLTPGSTEVWKTATLAATDNDVVAMELARSTAYFGFYLQPCVFTGVSYIGQLSTCAALIAVGEASANSQIISMNAYARIVGTLWGDFGLYLPGLGQVINYGTTWGPHTIFDQSDLIYSREIDIGTGVCSETCHGYTCDYWLDQRYSCAELESTCDCSGCPRCAGECNYHDECPTGEYCNSIHICFPCEGCQLYSDAVDGVCPGKCHCSNHSDCPAETFCNKNHDCWACDECGLAKLNEWSSIDDTCPCDGHQGCEETCHGHSCDYWTNYECSELEDTFGCDCSGCARCYENSGCSNNYHCPEGHYCDRWKNCRECEFCDTYDDAITGSCPSKCDAQRCVNSCVNETCDSWTGHTCTELETDFGCNCDGCDWCTEGCPETCHGHTCDYWLSANKEYTCNILEENFGCDCWGCATCPEVVGSACSTHTDCAEGTEYCDLEGQCWRCAFCDALADGIDGTCGESCNASSTVVCGAHSECGSEEFCHSNGACTTCVDCTTTNAFDGSCSTCGDCTTHDDCSSDEYCDIFYDCFECSSCSTFLDAIDGVCPAKCTTSGCTTHDHCSSSEYCDSYESCYDCGGCALFNDAIDGACPLKCSFGCTNHDECPSDEYCDAYGNCYGCVACASLNDAIDGSCPLKCENSGCANHDDCSSDEYCDYYGSCYDCTHCSSLQDAIDGLCPAKCTTGCTNHTDCDSSSYCDVYGDCYYCSTCQFYLDAIDGSCPSKCANIGCASTCLGFNCDYWTGHTCTELETVYSCDCTNCPRCATSRRLDSSEEEEEDNDVVLAIGGLWTGSQQVGGPHCHYPHGTVANMTLLLSGYHDDTLVFDSVLMLAAYETDGAASFAALYEHTFGAKYAVFVEFGTSILQRITTNTTDVVDAIVGVYPEPQLQGSLEQDRISFVDHSACFHLDLRGGQIPVKGISMASDGDEDQNPSSKGLPFRTAIIIAALAFIILSFALFLAYHYKKALRAPLDGVELTAIVNEVSASETTKLPAEKVLV